MGRTVSGRTGDIVGERKSDTGEREIYIPDERRRDSGRSGRAVVGEREERKQR